MSRTIHCIIAGVGAGRDVGWPGLTNGKARTRDVAAQMLLARPSAKPTDLGTRRLTE